MIKAKVLRKDGFRFFFYSNEGNEPPHIHVQKGDAVSKIWLVPKTDIVYVVGFSNAEVKQIVAIVFEYAEHFKQQWNEYFGK